MESKLAKEILKNQIIGLSLKLVLDEKKKYSEENDEIYEKYAGISADIQLCPNEYFSSLKKIWRQDTNHKRFMIFSDDFDNIINWLNIERITIAVEVMNSRCS